MKYRDRFGPEWQSVSAFRNLQCGRLTRLIVVGLLLAAPMVAQPSAGLEFSPTADARGFVNVWKLREDVVKIEADAVTDDPGNCESHTEASVDAPAESWPQRERRWKAREKCLARIEAKKAHHQQVRNRFNSAWLPVLTSAVKHGDVVAEVILRQCQTTTELDRDTLESTCDPEQARRDVAAARLREIGFAPAFDWDREVVPAIYPHTSEAEIKAQLALNQKAALDGIRAGAMGFARMQVATNGNLAKTEDDVQAYLRNDLINAAMQDAPRAFTIASGAGWGNWRTNVFAGLRLNRVPLTPETMTWGQRLFSGVETWTGNSFWRSPTMEMYGPREGGGHRKFFFDKDNPAFVDALKTLMEQVDAGIDQTLLQEPRWAVFLLHRVGWHEFEPEGMHSDTGKLQPEWAGNWQMTMAFRDLKPMTDTPGAQIIIRVEGDPARADVFTYGPVDPPLSNARDCALRYSGGSTFLPDGKRHSTSATGTVLGYLPNLATIWAGSPGPVAPFAPLNPAIRYRQVLMQCSRGEWRDNTRIRFLLLAGDTLVEVAKEQEGGNPLYLRHYRRLRPNELFTDKRPWAKEP